MTTTADEVEHAIYELREDARMWNAIANAHDARWFGGSSELHEQASFVAVRDLTMGLRRILDRGFRDKKTDAPLESGLASLYRLLEDQGLRSEGDRLRHMSAFRHLLNIADKSIAHANTTALRSMSVGASGVPGLAAHLSQPRLLFTMVNEVSNSYIKHVRDVDFEAIYLDRSRLMDPFRGQVQRAGVPWVDFHLTDIFLDPSLLAPDLRKRPEGLSTEQLVAYVTYCLRCVGLAATSNHPVAFGTDAVTHHRGKAEQLLAPLTRSKRSRVEERLRAKGLTLFAPLPRGQALLETRKVTIRLA